MYSKSNIMVTGVYNKYFHFLISDELLRNIICAMRLCSLNSYSELSMAHFHFPHHWFS